MSQPSIEDLVSGLFGMINDTDTAARLRDMDPEAAHPYDTWDALIETPATPGAVSSLAVAAWLEHYDESLSKLCAQHMAGTTPQTLASDIVRLLDTLTGDYGQDNHGERFRGSFPHMLLFGATLRAASMMLDRILSTVTGQGPAPDCGDPTCPGHAQERAAQAQVPMPATHVVPRGDVRQVAALDGPLTGLYL